MTMRVADYIAQAVADHGVRHVFLVTGGGAMFLNDAFGHQPRLRCVCNHHEQASAMAAEGYARVTGGLGVVNVTTGPGAINALNGVFGAWTDSIPLLIVSGQVKRETLLATYGLNGRLRQLGDQEADIIRMVQGITKYAVLVTDPQTIRYHLEKALFLARAGRPGPCWIDVPIDVQSIQIDPDRLKGYDPSEDELTWDADRLREQCRDVLARLRSAQRPVVMAGSGVRHAGAVELFQSVVRHLGVPVTTAWTHDLIDCNDPFFCGRPGGIGERAGNLAVQNADVLLVLGSRLNVRQVSYNWKAFARCAFKVQVDVDAAELDKPTVRPDLPIHCDVKVFLEEMDRQLRNGPDDSARHRDWLAWCKERVRRYPVLQPKHLQAEHGLNPYHFIDQLWQRLADDDVVISGDATACIVPYQVARIRGTQRLISNSGCASMGHDLPAAVGAAVARAGKRVVCLAGDGSIQLNIQELQTVVHHRLPIKLFVLNNGGYLSIRTTQKNFFGRLIGTGPENGVSFPDMVKVAAAYGIPAARLDGPAALGLIDEALRCDGPFLCDVVLDPAQTFEPRPSSRQLPDGRIVTAPLEDLFPFLDREEFLDNMLIPPLAD